MNDHDMLLRIYYMFRGTGSYALLYRLAREPKIRLSAREQADIALMREIEKRLEIRSYEGMPYGRENAK